MSNNKINDNNSMISNREKALLIGRIKLALIIIVPFIILNMVTSGKILTGSNLSSVFTTAVTSIFMAWCFCFLFSTGMIDLSVGAILILAGNVGGIFAVQLGLGTFGLLFGSILTAVLLLVLNMYLLQITKIPAWIFGIGAAMVYEAVGMMYGSYQISQGRQVVSLRNTARALGGQPWNIVVVLIGLIAAYILFNRTSAGYNIQALGSNSRVSKMMGVNVKKTLLLSALIGGIFLGISGAVNESYASRVMPVTGLNSVALIFTALAGYLLADSLKKYMNLTISIIVGIFIISAIFNVLTILGVPSGTWQQTVMGLIVIVSGIVSQRNYEGVVK
jgi:ribose transport system permease protein